jgi:putative transposase
LIVAQVFQTTHVRRYHKHYGTSGHLWQGRYKSFEIENDEQLLTAVRYIEANPVRANMVKSAIDWPWSSHRERVGTGSRDAAPGSSIGGACPVEEEASSIGGACPSITAGMLSTLPIGLPQLWTEYVDTPMTATELSKLQEVKK